jgi:hypothetical protein
MSKARVRVRFLRTGTNRMSGLTRILAIKITLTVIVWCIPLLLFPTRLLLSLGFPVPEPQIFLRLLGMAYTALVVGYGFGLRASSRGSYPAGVVWVGIVSNGGACLLLAVGAMLGVWDSWGVVARAIMWSSLLGTGAIAVGLVVFGPCRSMLGRADSE